MLAQSVNHVTLDTSPSPTKSERDSANTKPYKHTQTLALRKAKGIVRFWNGWCGGAVRGRGVLLLRLREGRGGKTAVRSEEIEIA